MVKTYKDKLIEHIEALNKSYDNVILLLNDDLEKDEKTSKVSMKDDKKKTFAEGVMKLGEASEYLLVKIKQKNEELDSLNKKGKGEKETPQKEGKGDHGMNQHLE
jgi:hypothetical protein